MESDDFPFFLVSCPWKFPRISPGQVQNYQLFGGLLVSVKSIEKLTSTQEQVQKYCNSPLKNPKRRFFCSSASEGCLVLCRKEKNGFPLNNDELCWFLEKIILRMINRVLLKWLNSENGNIVSVKYMYLNESQPKV